MEWLNLIANNVILQALAQTLMHFTWQGTVVAVALAVVLKNLDIRKSDLRYGISLAALLCCVVAPVATFMWLLEPEVTPQSVDVNQVLSGVTATVIQAGGSLNESGYLGLSLLTTELLDYFNSSNFLLLMPFFAVAWLVCVALLSSRVLLQMIGVCQLPYQSTHLPEPQLQQIFERLLLQLNVTARARLFISDKVDVPMAIGWLKPVVLLPSSMVLGLTPGQLEMLLVHELAHVKRHDYIVNFLQTLVELMLFFHPGVKWISKQIRLERECCCDNIAVSQIGSPVAYACTLTDAEMSRAQNIPDLAMAASGSDLKQRILRVVGHSDCSTGHSRVRYTAILAAVISLCSVVTIVATNQIEEPAPMLLKEDIQKVNMTNEKVTSVAANQAADNTSNETSSAEIPETNNQPEAKQQLVATQKSIDSSTEQVNSDSVSVVEDIAEPVANQVSDKKENAELLAKQQGENVPIQQPDTSTETLTAATSSDAEIAPETAESEIVSTHVAAVKEQIASGLATPTSSLAPGKSQYSTSAAAKGAISGLVYQSLANYVSSGIAPEKQHKQPETESTPSQKPAEQAIATAPPVLLDGEAPVYPRQALRRRLSDDVAVSFVVNTAGEVEDIAFEGDVHRSFQKSVKRALQNWQFKPAQQNGRAVSSTITRVFSFTEPENKGLTTTGTRIYTK